MKKPHPIIVMLWGLAALVVTLAFINTGVNSYFFYFQERPLQNTVKNLSAQRNLLNSIMNELFLIENDFLNMMYSDNMKLAQSKKESIDTRLGNVRKAYSVLMKGGTYTDVLQVNENSYDYFNETIFYDKSQTGVEGEDLANILPKLAGLRQAIDACYALVSGAGNWNNEPFEKTLKIKQTKALIHRSKELVRGLYIHIVEGNSKAFQQIEGSQWQLRLVNIVLDMAFSILALIVFVLVLRNVKKVLHKMEQAKERIDRSNRDLKTIVQGLPVGVVLIGEDKQIRSVNQVASDILGFDSSADANSSMCGKKCYDTFCDIGDCSCPILDYGKPYVAFEEKPLKLAQGSGSNKNILKSVIPITLDDKRVLMEVFIDISRQKRAEEIIRKHNEELETLVAERTHELQEALDNIKRTQVMLIQSEKLASLGVLAAGVAHEINTPMQYIADNAKFIQNSLKSLTPLVREMVCSDSPEEEACNHSDARSVKLDELEFMQTEMPLAAKEILDGVGKVIDIIRSMKAFSHPGGQEKMLHDINESIRISVKISRNEWKYVADVETDLDPEMPQVSCYPNELNQVVLNMIINASQAVASNTRAGDPKGLICITSSFTDKLVVFRVSDSGPGIPLEIQNRIFDPFFTTKEVGQGTGQGLAMAWSVITEKHLGTIDFETGPDGTTFTVTLPRA